MSTDLLKLLHNNREKSITALSAVSNTRIMRLNRKTKNLYRDEDLENFGLGKEEPVYRCDVLGSSNVTGDYYVNAQLLIPVGTIFPFAGANAPTGYLVCDGSDISRNTYARLFSIIANTYGPGNGETTFSLPDLRGRTLIGVGTGSGLTPRNLADIGGTETHTLTLNEIPQHSHNVEVSNLVHKDGADTVGNPDATGDELNLKNSISNTFTSGGINGRTNPNVASDAHNNMQPFMTINYIIRY
ncbi:hypothetical protein crov148 [Cafeteria roenbergensis virus]|uniref:Phage tail collar domain-containing protein n=1 Tax=Cafeteria roenbergensis virus (strain BV-PW1) TaxID=693272 RepID=E3T4R8_CROVB|nr:tail protein [Cafeteria roenbergensis virus BV-PW1]ADO67181.1 hypothetical protein crov148 [Cafeteria roenbergensis virus BV-PW1]